LWPATGGIDLPKDRARIVWFGKHGTRNGGAGMMLLSPLLPLLEKVHRHRPIELVVISNNWSKFNQLCEGTTIYARYERWTNRRTFQELDGAQIFLMPTADDAFSMCKSANRAVMALSSNVPVVAAYLEDLEPLRDAMVIDDWALGIERYLFDETGRGGDLEAAKAIIEREYSPAAIADHWAGLLTAERAGLHLAAIWRSTDPASGATARQPKSDVTIVVIGESGQVRAALAAGQAGISGSSADRKRVRGPGECRGDY
jgi:hypothetical protein